MQKKEPQIIDLENDQLNKPIQKAKLDQIEDLTNQVSSSDGQIIKKDNKNKNQFNEEFDKLYQQQQQRIKQEIEEEPLISERMQTILLLEEYKMNELFQNKIMDLIQNQQKEYIRRTRKDGSCFYRGFLFRLSEILQTDKQYFTKYKIFDKVKEGTELMIKAGFDKIVFEDFQDIYEDLMNRIKNGQKDLSKFFNHKMMFDYLVMYLRFLMSAFIRVNSEKFLVYFESLKHLQTFCSKEIEPIDSETDQIQIMALYNFFEIPIRIFYVDNTKSNQATCFSLPDTDSIKQGNIFKTDKNYKIQFIYKPGHYDIIYQQLIQIIYYYQL